MTEYKNYHVSVYRWVEHNRQFIQGREILADSPMQAVKILVGDKYNIKRFTKMKNSVAVNNYFRLHPLYAQVVTAQDGNVHTYNYTLTEV